MNVILRLTTILCLFATVSCGSRDTGDGAGIARSGNAFDSTGTVEVDGRQLSCNLTNMRQWVDANMRDYYLFYNQVPTVNLADYDDLNTLIEALRVQPNDEFSYITDAEQASAQFEQGIMFGFGHRIAQPTAGVLRFTQIDPGSPLATAGVARGDKLLTINGVSPFDVTPLEIEIFYGVNAEPATMTFDIENAQGQIRNLSLTSASYAMDTVLATDVITRGSTKIGYLAFDSFLETSKAELDTAFANFKQENIGEMVLDLRYNRGGRISVAQKLASLIAGNTVQGEVFVTFAQNDKYSQNNESFNFTTEAQALQLSRLVVLTTNSSCSASELIINSLEPFIDVTVIGSSTCGKPYGSLPRTACGQQMNALEYELVNANSAGGYYNGITADCVAVDDIDRSLGDPLEGMLKAGLDYITDSVCQTAVIQARTAQTQIKSRTLPGNYRTPSVNLFDGLVRPDD